MVSEPDRRNEPLRGTDRALAIVLFVIGVTGMLAIGAVLMPIESMAAIHRRLGLGDMPAGPIVEYLARCTSAFYALFGAVCVLLARDVRRYRPLVTAAGVLFVVLGAALIGIDLHAGLPGWWVAQEGPFAIAAGVAIVLLARRGARSDRVADGA